MRIRGDRPQVEIVDFEMKKRLKMRAVIDAHFPPRKSFRGNSLPSGIGWGALGGLVATLVMDLILIGILLIAGLPALTCFSIVGDTVASLLSLTAGQTGSNILFGIAAHYMIGPLFGAVLGAAVVSVKALQVDTLKKGVVIGIVFAEILSQPMLALAPILLPMTLSDTLLWFGGSFVMHLIWGGFSGGIVYRALRKPLA